VRQEVLYAVAVAVFPDDTKASMLRLQSQRAGRIAGDFQKAGAVAGHQLEKEPVAIQMTQNQPTT
jgi:hypothetical protein